MTGHSPNVNCLRQFANRLTSSAGFGASGEASEWPALALSGPLARSGGGGEG